MIEWLFSGMTILGAVLNAKGDKNGFLVWIAANICWIYSNIQSGMHAQIPVWVVMSVISVYGYMSWRKNYLKYNS